MSSTTRWWTKDTVAVVTGSNKGIGYEIVKRLASEGLTVVLTARDQARGEAAIESLRAEGLETIWFHQLEVNRSESVQILAKWLKDKFGGIDILVNNAGVNSGPTGPISSYENAEAIIATNYYGVKKVTEGLWPLLRASSAGARIVNVSSRLGLYDRLRSEKLKETFRAEDKYTEDLVESLVTKYLEDVRTDRVNEEGWIETKPTLVPMYSESKIFLNAYAIALVNSLSKSQPEDHKILITTFCPGVTKTDMFARSVEDGYEVAEGFGVKTPEDGADTGVWLALLPKEELIPKAGKFFGERTEYAFGWVNPGF